MPFLLEIVLVYLLLVAAHLLGFVIVARAFRIGIVCFAYGYGSALFTRGRIRINAVPLGGYVKLKDTRLASEEGARDAAPVAGAAYDQQPRWVQALVQLGGPALLILIALLVIPGSAVRETLEGFSQVVLGAFGPTSTAQAHIVAAQETLRSGGFLVLTGLLATKIAAFNLLPLPMLNGGGAILTLLLGSPGEPPAWLLTTQQWSVTLMLAGLASWLYAVGFFVAQH